VQNNGWAFFIDLLVSFYESLQRLWHLALVVQLVVCHNPCCQAFQCDVVQNFDLAFREFLQEVNGTFRQAIFAINVSPI
jgi:hypothetical protein